MGRREFADISNYTVRFDAQQYARYGCLLVGVLATDGPDFESGRYIEQAAHAHEARLAVWHYHFCRPELDPGGEGEAARFWTVVRPHYQPGDRLWLDIERQHPAGVNATNAYLRKVATRLHHISGVHAGGYTYDAFLREHGGGLQVTSTDWWVANYGGRIARLGAGRRLIAAQISNGQVGGDPKRLPGVLGADTDRLQRWAARRLSRERGGRR